MRSILKHLGREDTKVKWTSTITVPPDELQREVAALGNQWRFILKRKLAERLKIIGWNIRDFDLHTGIIRLKAKPNLVVNIGFQYAMDRNFDISARTKVQTMGVDNGTTNPTATSLSSTNGGGSDTGSTSRRLIAFDSTPTRAASVVTCIGTFTQANVSFTMKRLFLSRAAAGTTDADNDLYSMTNVFTMDLSVFSTWSQTFTATVTGSGS